MTPARIFLSFGIGILSVAALSKTSVGKPERAVRADGIGPVKIGMTRSQLSSVLHVRIDGPGVGEDESCYYSEPTAYPGLAFMIQNKRLVRIDVDRTGIKSVRGLQIGDSEQHAIAVYGRMLHMEPSQYDGPEGHYLTLHTTDKRYGLRFETDEGKITSYYAGTTSAIALVEGCE